MLELDHLAVMTPARAKEAGIRTHADAVLVCVMYPDGADPLAVNILSLARVCELIAELAPRSITVEGAFGEDCSGLRKAVLGPTGGATLH